MGTRNDFDMDDRQWDAVEADIELRRFDDSLLGDVDEIEVDEVPEDEDY